MSASSVGAEPQSPEERSKWLVREEFNRLLAQSDFFDWQLRLHDAGDYLVLFARIVKSADRIFVMKLECDDYPAIAPKQGFIDPSLFDSADEMTLCEGQFYPHGPYVDVGRLPLPVLCIKGHRDFYANGWHGGWTDPPAHDHTLYQHVVNVRNAILDAWA
jgi:hypothetical protein